MSAGRIALLVQLATTLPLVGLIWLIQIVSYPLFARVGVESFPAYHAGHARLITFVVAPLMLCELAAAIVSVIADDPAFPRAASWCGLALATTAWAVTLLVSVPRHEILAAGFDVRAHSLLVSTNWLRTVVWTLRGALLLWVTARLLGDGVAASR